MATVQIVCSPASGAISRSSSMIGLGPGVRWARSLKARFDPCWNTRASTPRVQDCLLRQREQCLCATKQKDPAEAVPLLVVIVDAFYLIRPRSELSVQGQGIKARQRREYIDFCAVLFRDMLHLLFCFAERRVIKLDACGPIRIPGMWSYLGKVERGYGQQCL